VCGADGGGQRGRAAGARVRVGGGAGELDDMLVAVLDGPGDGFLGGTRADWESGGSVCGAGPAGA
jgi:hypothetical protein